MTREQASSGPVRYVLAAEDLLQRAVADLCRRLGRPIVVQPFTGYGGDGWMRVAGRVVVDLTARRPHGTGSWAALRANLRQFLTVEVPHADVRVVAHGETHLVRADREGYVDALVPAPDLSPGRHEILLQAAKPGSRPALAQVLVPDSGADLAVVSDIDDTVIDSGITRGVLATVTTALLRHATARVPLPGAAEFYRALQRGPEASPQRPFFYLSTSPWNLASFLTDFLARHGFPDGPLLLTDWGPGSHGLLRIGTQQHKLTALRRLAADFPDLRFVLIGDSGQQDAQIYTAFASEQPARVAAVYIRLAGSLTWSRQQQLDQCSQQLAEDAVQFLATTNSTGMAAHARSVGLLR